MNNLPEEDGINIRELAKELGHLKLDLSTPEIYASVGEEQLLLWIEEIESIKKVINHILRTVQGN